MEEEQQKLQQFIEMINLQKLECSKNASTDQLIISQLKEIVKIFKQLKDKNVFINLIISSLKGPQSPTIRIEFTKVICFFTKAKVIGISTTMDLFVILLKFKDKALRTLILHAINKFVSCCRTVRKRTSKKKRLAFSVQDSSLLKQKLFCMLQNAENEPICARIAQMVLIYAYQKQFWQTEKVVNILADCVFFDRIQRIQVSAMRFFLGSSKNEQGNGEDSDSSDDSEIGTKNKSLRELMQQHKYTKKTRKRKKQLDEAKKREGREKRTKKSSDKLTRSQCNLEAIRSIYDPQKFSDRLFGLLAGQKRNEKYVVRLLQISLCARVIGIHKLQTLGFYSYLHRYLQPKQKEVTRLLLYAAQACHEFVPSDLVEQLVRVIAQNFVTDRNSDEAITVGLNTIREIYSNCPDAANEGMVRDLAEYKHTHNKNLSTAVHSLIVLLRAKKPHLLHHKDRGRPPPKQKLVENEEDEEMEESEDDDELMDNKSEDEDDENNQIEQKKDESTTIDGLPRLKDIEHFSKKRKQTKEERMEQVRLGREDRKTTYAKPKKRGAHVGRTNRELAKRKNFKMVQHKMRGKNRQRSFRDRQQSLRLYLLRQQGKKV